MPITNHPLRQWAVDEMHLRRFAPVSDDCQIYQSVLLIGEDQRQSEDQHLIAEKPPFDDWHLAPRSASAHTQSGIYFLWERHTEASTITLILPSAPTTARQGPQGNGCKKTAFHRFGPLRGKSSFPSTVNQTIQLSC